MSRPEEKAQRIACELDHGQINQAATELRREVDFNPREALAVIQMANQMRDQRGPEHIVIDPNGCVEIRDEYRHQQVYAGALNFNNDVYGNRGDQNQGYPNNYGQPENGAYRQPPTYEQPGSINIPDCYGNQERQGINPGLAIGIGVVGGLLLNRALGHGGEYRPREHHRR